MIAAALYLPVRGLPIIGHANLGIEAPSDTNPTGTVMTIP